MEQGFRVGDLVIWKKFPTAVYRVRSTTIGHSIRYCFKDGEIQSRTKIPRRYYYLDWEAGGSGHPEASVLGLNIELA